MTRVKKLSRFLILLLAAVMALGSLLSPVSAVDIGKGKTEFGVTIHVEDTSTAGTDGDVYFVVKYIDGKTEQWRRRKTLKAPEFWKKIDPENKKEGGDVRAADD